MDKNQLKDMVIKAIEDNKGILLEVGRKIYANPEFGYKEFNTTKTIVDFLKIILDTRLKLLLPTLVVV